MELFQTCGEITRVSPKVSPEFSPECFRKKKESRNGIFRRSANVTVMGSLSTRQLPDKDEEYYNKIENYSFALFAKIFEKNESLLYRNSV